jgi:RNA recognition motif-containing protein
MQVFVGNIPFSASEEDVRELFARYGQVQKVQIATDRETGRPRGFGFVEMPSTAEAEAAIAAVHGTSLDGRPLSVSAARPRERRASWR